MNKMTLLLLPVFLSGCHIYNTPPAIPANYYYLNPAKDLSAIGRTALIELDNDSSYPQISAEVTDALFEALQKKQVFGLTLVRQNDPVWRSLQLDLNSTYTPEQLTEVNKTLKCNAVLTGTVTKYQPYPRMIIGLRLKLVDLTDGQLLWGIEHIWDSTDKTIEYRIKNYFQREVRAGFEPLREQLATISPLTFLKFVAYEVAKTLKPED